MRIRFVPLVLLVVATAALPQDMRPKHNASYVPDDNEATRGLVAQALEAAGGGDVDGAVEALQALLLNPGKGVVAVRGRELFVSPRRWATLMLLSGRAPFGKQVLVAWRKLHGPTADAALRAALAAGSQRGVLALVGRYPAASTAPEALLALADRELQRGDRDAAMGFLLRAPEHVPASEMVAWLARPGYRERLAHLRRNPAPAPRHWPTLGGDNSRARNGDALPATGLRRLWETPFLDPEPPAFVQRATQSQREHSPLLPFYPVFDEDNIYLHVGVRVAVIDRGTGKLLYQAPGGGRLNEQRVDSMLAAGPGLRAATLSKGMLYFCQARFGFGTNPLPHNNLIAFDTRRRSVAWAISKGPGRKSAILRKPIYFRGAPAVERGRVYVYGAVKEKSEGKPSRKEEAYLFCFDADKGNLIWHRFLGYGDTDAAAQLPPQSGLAPALRYGVVVALTGLGVCAALDADTGEFLWLFRYDRKPGRERQRLTEWSEKQVHVRSGWFREAPRIVDDMVFLAPMDSDQRYGCWLRGFLDADGQFYLQQWAVERSANPGRNSLLEQIAGIAGDRIYYVGRRDERAGAIETYQTVVSTPMRRGEDGFAYARIPAIQRDPSTGRRVPPEIFGRSAIAGSVLLIPTRRTLFRFDLAKRPGESRQGSDLFLEIAPLPNFAPKHAEPRDGIAPRPLFGTLIPLGGRLYAVTADRIVCYGK